MYWVWLRWSSFSLQQPPQGCALHWYLKGADNTPLIWLLLSSAGKVFGLSPQHSLSSRLGWGGAKSWEGPHPGRLIPTDQRDIPYHMMSQQLIKRARGSCGAHYSDVCILEQLPCVPKACSLGSGTASSADGK